MDTKQIKQAFISPSVAYRGKPFWSWNGDLKEEEINEIKDYCVNPVDSQMAAMEKPESLEMEMVRPDDVAVIDGFIDMNEEELEGFRRNIEELADGGYITCNQSGRTYTLNATTKGTVIEIPTEWLDRIMNHEYTSENVSWQAVLKVFLWIINQNS